MAADNRKILFGHGSISKLEGELAGGIPRYRDDHCAGGHAIEAVHKIDRLAELVRHHGVEIWGLPIHPVPVRKHGRRFIDDDDVSVLMQYLNGAAALRDQRL